MKVLKLIVGLAFLLVPTAGLMMLTPGCQSLNPQPPVEQMTKQLLTEAIVPGIKEGLAQGVKTMAVQAGAQGINPKYVFEFQGKWVVGIEGKATVGVEGIAGQIQVTTQAGDETVPSPYILRPVESQPASQPAQ